MEITIETVTLPTDTPGAVESELVQSMQRASRSLSRLNEGALAFARERPGACVIGAVCLGFIVGKIASRY